MTATHDGGGIANSGPLTVTNSTFSGNTATMGCGIVSVFRGTLTLTSTVVGRQQRRQQHRLRHLRQ